LKSGWKIKSIRIESGDKRGDREMSIIWVELADFLEEKLNKLIKELEETYNLDQDEALLEVKKLVDSWASMRGLIQEKSARDVM